MQRESLKRVKLYRNSGIPNFSIKLLTLTTVFFATVHNKSLHWIFTLQCSAKTSEFKRLCSQPSSLDPGVDMVGWIRIDLLFGEDLEAVDASLVA